MNRDLGNSEQSNKQHSVYHKTWYLKL